MLGRTKDQITSKEQVNSALNACQTLDLNGLIVIGGICLDFNPKQTSFSALSRVIVHVFFLHEGVTSNTDAAQLAETFAEAKCLTKVFGNSCS